MTQRSAHSGSRTPSLGRIALVVGFLVALWGWVGYALWQTQIVQGATYEKVAKERFARLKTDPLSTRGSVFARSANGSMLPLAQSSSRTRLLVNPQTIEHPDSLFVLLEEHASHFSPDAFNALMQQEGWVEVKEDLSSDFVAAARRELANDEGVRFVREARRAYPLGELAAHVIGAMGYVDNATYQKGIYGVEAQYDAVLTHARTIEGRGWLSLVVHGIQSWLPTAALPHGDVELTLDVDAQRALEGELDRVWSEWHAKEVGGVILNPRTGEILAMAARPAYDPNKPLQNAGTLANPLTQHTYEFGSVMKPLTVAFGLEAGVITASSTYHDTGSAQYDGATIRNYDGRARGVVDVQQILSQSLNVGAAWVATQLPPQWFVEKLKRFAATPTGVDLPETTGSVRNVEAGVAAGRHIEVATASFGQGFRTTPLAMARALAALANGGVMPPVHIGRAIITPLGTRIPLAPATEGERLTSQEAAFEVTRMLVRVVDETLAHGKHRDPAYTTAAKTGTAQIARQGGGGYREDAYLHSFFGYFPAYEPRYLIFLYHVEPQGARYASETLTEPFMRLRDYLLARDLPPPDRQTVGGRTETR